MNHAHNTHAQHHIASRWSRRRYAWHAAAQYRGHRPPWADRAETDKSGQHHPDGQPRHTRGHAASPAGTSPRRRSCGRVRARRPADH
jgi:hypothetical protein